MPVLALLNLMLAGASATPMQHTRAMPSTARMIKQRQIVLSVVSAPCQQEQQQHQQHHLAMASSLHGAESARSDALNLAITMKGTPAATGE